MPGATEQSDKEKLLIGLRKRENSASEQIDNDLFEDDDYVAYDAQLTDLVKQIALRTNDREAWRALTYMRYNGDSAFGKWLAQYSQALPFLTEQLSSRHSVRRMNAVYVVAAMMANSKTENLITSGQYRELKMKIRNLASHDVAPVSESAIQGLGMIKDVRDASFLDNIARSSHDIYVKKSARDAAQAIRTQ